ncbi:MAG TPA: AAA family ATPase [Acidimicrobiales bacterium]|jgi:hypothetical protein
MVRQLTPRPAVRKGQRARVALAGPAGAGKTWTALEVAKVLGGRVVQIDTERGSGSLYSDRFDYETVDWLPPYDPRELGQAVVELGGSYDVVLVDSLSHFWMGEGGTLDVVDAAAARSRGNSYAGWKEGTPAQNDMVAGLLASDAHVIVTMRSKVEYILETDAKGKQVPRRIGMAPVQRDGIEYEFTVTADLDHEHTLVVAKTRCDLIEGKAYKRGHTAEMAETLAAWLGSAEPLVDRMTVEALVARMNGIPDPDTRKRVKEMFVACFGSPSSLTEKMAVEAAAWLDEQVPTPPSARDNDGMGEQASLIAAEGN